MTTSSTKTAAQAHGRYIRGSASKVRRVLDQIRITKVLRSAVANAENNLGLDPSSLVITTATADMGPPMKRYRPRAQGRAFAIKKQTCHISIAVSANQSNNSEDSD